MKKTVLAALVLALALCLAGCGRFVSILPGSALPQTSLSNDLVNTEEKAVFEERPLLAFMGRDGFAESYYTDTPAALSYQRTAEDGSVGCRAYVFDRATIIAACDALRGIMVTGVSPEAPVKEEEYTLTMANGDEYVFTFGVLADGQTRVLRMRTGDYSLSGGDVLWGIEFPAYSAAYGVFDLYFDSAIRAFADNFYNETPVSVGYRMNSGASITSTDPAAVEGVFRALAGASVIVVENQPDQNVDLNQTRDYFFTMEDGTRYTFSFAQRCLVVTANPSFGPVYYWISGTDDLWDVEIMSESEDAAFEGGPVADLREDIRRASDIADGTYDADITVLGVFVEYAIGEESGYIALSGDDAAAFVRRVCAIEATGETVAEPAGDKLTVSVSLSDMSGPIFYFTGDTIQQVVGTSYVCDSEAMSALREQVLELAASGENTAEVEEGGTE